MGKLRKKYILTLLLSAAVFLLLAAAAALLSRGVGGGNAGTAEHPLRISEFMTSNTLCPDAQGVFCDWVEIENCSDRDFNLSGYLLSDDLTQARYGFPVGTVVPAGGFVVVYCDPTRSGALYAPFALNRRGGETLILMNPANTVLDEVETLRAAKNCSQIRLADGSLTVSATPTPGFPNTEAGYAQYLAALGQDSSGLRLSEVMAANTLIPAPDGAFCDWIELENTGAQTLSLAGWRLSDREGESRYVFPEGTQLPPGAFLVVWCNDAGAPFRLAKAGGETLSLLTPDGVAADRLPLPALADNESYARWDGGDWVAVRSATPGFANSQAGHEEYLASLGYGEARPAVAALVIKNETGLTDADGEVQDWICLRNDGAGDLSLEGWFLSDDAGDTARWSLPAVTLAPGESLLVFCSGKDRRDGELHTDFALSAGETLCLSTPTGTLVCAVDCPALAGDAAWCLQTDGSYAESAPPDMTGARRG